ncbi:MAG: cob(I)yrinic acid a,c-diamide adenosyltransferase [Candidatus Aenigmarchaeota archaeon]|nr:cob(I)yrinic acid a,c-diamide adenosyltransferase [Candidatus Aenigmarchaeota archaeon]
MTKIYNRSGDVIHTSLFGGEQISKDSLIVAAYGTIDELNSFLGFARARIAEKDMQDMLKDFQDQLLKIGSDLATPLDKKPLVERISASDVKKLEEIIDRYDKNLPKINRFIIPGGSVESGILHICRAVCRRAERTLVTLMKERQINDEVLMYINRLSDLLFVLAREMNKRRNSEEEFWSER